MKPVYSWTRLAPALILATAHDAAYADDRDAAFQFRGKGPDYFRGTCREGCTGEAARFLPARTVFRAGAGKRSVRGDQAVQPFIQKDPAEFRDLFVRDVRSHFHEDGNLPPGFRRHVRLFRFQGSQQARGGLSRLEVAQTRRIGGGEVNGNVVRHGPRRSQAGQVVLGGIFVRRHLVFADVDTKHPVEAGGLPDVFHAGGNAVIVEAHSIDDGTLGNEAEQAGLVLAGLGARRQRSHLHKAESHLAEGADRIRLLVHPGGKAHPVGEFHAQDFHRIGRYATHQEGENAHPFSHAQPEQRQVVGSFRIQLEQQTFGSRI